MRDAWTRGEILPDLIGDRAIDAVTIAGDPESCRAKLAALQAAGLTAPVISPVMVTGGPEFKGHLEWLQKNVLRDFY